MQLSKIYILGFTVFHLLSKLKTGDGSLSGLTLCQHFFTFCRPGAVLPGRGGTGAGGSVCSVDGYTSRFRHGSITPLRRRSPQNSKPGTGTCPVPSGIGYAVSKFEDDRKHVRCVNPRTENRPPSCKAEFLRLYPYCAFFVTSFH